MINDEASFCPGCGAPRTHVRERLERQAAESGVPYEQLLRQAREEDFRNRAMTGFATPVTPPVYTPPVDREKKSNKLWWILGGVGGGLLLICVACVVVALVFWERSGIEVGEGESGAVIRRQLELAEEGRFQERWQLLHPAQREAVPAVDFVNCGRTFTIEEFDVLLTRNANVEDANIPFINSGDVRAVDYVYVQDGETFTATDYVVRQGDTWYWTLSLDEISAFRQGGCP
jgi:hypothetical protein